MEVIYKNEIAKETEFKGYFATRSGKILSAKVKGGQGRIDYNKVREHCFKIDKDGYLEYCFSENGKHYYRRGHRVVWETFYGKIEGDLTIDHIDSNTQNNNISNLRLLSREENTSIAIKNKKSPKRFLYQVNNEILDRKEIQIKFSLSNKFWYNEKNKIKNTDNFIYSNIIFKRV